MERFDLNFQKTPTNIYHGIFELRRSPNIFWTKPLISIRLPQHAHGGMKLNFMTFTFADYFSQHGCDLCWRRVSEAVHLIQVRRCFAPKMVILVETWKRAEEGNPVARCSLKVHFCNFQVLSQDASEYDHGFNSIPRIEMAGTVWTQPIPVA